MLPRGWKEIPSEGTSGSNWASHFRGLDNVLCNQMFCADTRSQRRHAASSDWQGRKSASEQRRVELNKKRPTSRENANQSASVAKSGSRRQCRPDRPKRQARESRRSLRIILIHENRRIGEHWGPGLRPDGPYWLGRRKIGPRIEHHVIGIEWRRQRAGIARVNADLDRQRSDLAVVHMPNLKVNLLQGVS